MNFAKSGQNSELMHENTAVKEFVAVFHFKKSLLLENRMGIIVLIEALERKPK